MSYLIRCVFFLAILFIQPAYSAEDTHSPAVHQTEAAVETPGVNLKDDSSPLFPASQLPIEESSDKFTSELLNMLLTLGMLVAVIFALSWILKRMLNVKNQQENVRSTIKILEKRSLSPKAALYLVEVFGKTLVVAESPTGFNCMATFDHTEESDDAEAKPQKSFEKILDSNK